jgi:hypothetical protein
MQLQLKTRRVDGKVVIEGRYLALKTFSQSDTERPGKLWLRLKACWAVAKLKLS